MRTQRHFPFKTRGEFRRRFRCEPRQRMQIQAGRPRAVFAATAAGDFTHRRVGWERQSRIRREMTRALD